MTHVSLFTGIGGLDLAAEWAGFETVLQVERDPYCLKVLTKHWPDVARITDVKEVHADDRWRKPTVVSGGFPCQPFSAAGKRGGTEDDRHLWPEMLRVVRELSPTYVVGENVSGLLSIDGGLVFETVCADLEREGYDVLPIHYPAASVGAPHRRDRVFIVAHARNKRSSCPRSNTQRESAFIESGDRRAEVAELSGNVAHADRAGQREQRWSEPVKQEHAALERGGWWESQSGVCRATDGLSPWLDGDWERGIPRVATGVKNRVARLKALGNAVVPAQAHPIFAAIAALENVWREKH